MGTLALYVTVDGDDGYWSEATGWFVDSANPHYLGNTSISGMGVCNVFSRYQNVTIPQGATITSASLSLRAQASLSTTTVNLRIAAIDSDNAAAPTSYNEAENAVRTTAYADWDDVEAFTASTRYDSPDIAAVVQEIVSRENWTPGNAIVFYIEDNGSSVGADRRITNRISGASYSIRLDVEYEDVIVPDETLEVSVPSGSDDGYWTAAESFDNNDHYVVVGYNGISACTGFFRFEGITIPQGATIQTAVLSCTGYAGGAGTLVPVHLIVDGQDADDGVAPTDYATAVAAARTAAQVEWHDIGAWATSTAYESPSLITIIQEIINRTGWASGNAIVLYLADDGSSTDDFYARIATSYEGSHPVELTIGYSAEGASSAFIDTLATSETISVDKHLVLVDSLATTDDEPIAKDIADSLSTSDALATQQGNYLADTLSMSEDIRVDKQLVLADTLHTNDFATMLYGDLASTRNHPHLSKWYMAVKVPRIIAKYTVTESRVDEEDNTISVGAPTYVAPFDGYVSTLPALFDYLGDCTLWVGSTDDAATRTDHGKARLRSVAANVLTVAADMHCDWIVGDTVCVVDVWELWPKLHHVEAADETVTMWKDTDIASTGRYEYPVPIFGPPACAFIDDALGYASVSFDGSLSYKVQPNSQSYQEGDNPDPVESWLGWENQGISSWAWTLEGAATPSPATAHVSATYATPGQYLAFLKVTDRDGLTSYGVRNVFIFDREETPVNPLAPVLPEKHFIINRLSGSLDAHGWQGEVEVFGDLFDADALVNGSQVVLFAEEWFGGVEKDFGVGHLFLTGRNNIKMVGWIADSHIAYNESGTREARMNIRGLQQYLKSATNYANYMTQADTDAPDWCYFACPDDGLTVRKYLYHMVQWHFTLLRFTDYLIPDDHNNYLPSHNAPVGGLDAQLDSFVSRIQARWCADKGGCLHVFSWPNYLPIQGFGVVWRNRLKTENTLTTADFQRLQIVPRLRDTAAKVRVESVIAFSTGAYQTSIDMTPGDVRNYGGANVVLGQQIVGTGGFEDSQGWELARMIHAEESRAIEEITLPMLGNYTHFDVVPNMAWTQVTASGGLRGITWNQKPFWVTGMRIEVDHKNGDTGTTLTLFPETMMSLSIRSYGQYDEVGEEAIEEDTGGSAELADVVSGAGEPEETIIPALLGDGSGHVETDSPGEVMARIMGDINQTVIAECRDLKLVKDRPVFLRYTKGDRNSGKPGQAQYTVVGPRRMLGEEGDEEEDRAYQWHRGVLCISGRPRVGTSVASLALPVTAQNLRLVSIDGYIRTAPIVGTGENTLGINLTVNGTPVGGVSFGNGVHKTSSTLTVPIWLEVGDILDLDVAAIPTTLAGADVTITAVCREYGV